VTFPDPVSGQDKPLLVFFPSTDGGDSIDTRYGIRPFIIFAPALSLDWLYYQSYAGHLASWGYVVFMRKNWSTSHLKLSQSTSGIIDWLVDLQSEDDGFFKYALDFGKIGTSGHSLGGKISLLTAALDARVRASAAIDPDDSLPLIPLPIDDYPSVTPELMDQIYGPTLFIGSELGSDCVPAEENYHQYYLSADSPAVEIDMLGAGHMSFLDNPDCGLPCAACASGTGDDDLVKSLTWRYITAFFNVYFLHLSEYESFITGYSILNDVAAGYVTEQHK